MADPDLIPVMLSREAIEIGAHWFSCSDDDARDYFEDSIVEACRAAAGLIPGDPQPQLEAAQQIADDFRRLRSVTEAYDHLLLLRRLAAAFPPPAPVPQPQPAEPGATPCPICDKGRDPHEPRTVRLVRNAKGYVAGEVAPVHRWGYQSGAPYVHPFQQAGQTVALDDDDWEPNEQRPDPAPLTDSGSPQPIGGMTEWSMLPAAPADETGDER